MSERIKTIVESTRTQHFITAVIVLNAITLGLETSAEAMAAFGPVLLAIDRLALLIFVVELTAKISVYRLRFFTSGWNWFDFVIVGISLVPGAGNLSVLRAFRIFRVLRLFSVVPKLRSVVQALLAAIPSGARFAEWFGTIGRSMYSLFEIMTFDNWSSGIVRPVMAVYPWAWVFFLPFIVVTSFAVLNLFIAIIVNTMQAQHEAELQQERRDERTEWLAGNSELAQEITELRRQVAALQTLLLKHETRS
ncbi:ion transporter [candidate division KSB1 bacterium]|nr:ion transporter [candidate division KSB1 bacterium]